jgi:transcription initiation factor IIE alpha subunit
MLWQSLLTLQRTDLWQDDLRVLEFHAGKKSVASAEIEKELSMDYRTVLDCLHRLHYEGLVYFTSQNLGVNESIVSAITKKGLRVFHEYKHSSLT